MRYLQTPSTTLIYIDNRVKLFLMFIIVSKCISTFSSQVILNFTIINIITSSIANFMHILKFQISCKYVTVATRQHDLSFACLTSEWRPIFRCARSLSTLWVQVVLWLSGGLFYPAVVSLLSPEKLSENDPMGEAPATLPNNITGLNE